MLYDDIDRSLARSLRRQILVALLACTALVGGFGGVAAYSEINGAVVGAGKFVAEGRTKQVQHPDGGIIAEILVREDQRVDAGQPLFRLDGTRVAASLGVVESQLNLLLVQQARLLAELAGNARLMLPEGLSGPEANALLEAQEELMAARSATRLVRISQLEEQISQHQSRLGAIEEQRTSLETNIELLDEQIANYLQLHQKGLLIDSTLSEVQRERTSLTGNLAALDAQLSEVQQARSVAQLQIAEIEESFIEDVLTELDQKRAEIGRLEEERIAALDRLDRLEIKSPISGFLHELSVHTIGGIVSPGETLVSIIPDEDQLLVEARLSPMDIDQVAVDQLARIRLSSLSQRTTPELYARVSDVSADLSIDETTGAAYYVMRLRLDPQELAKIEENVLRPGMPAEVFVQTEARTVLSYLVKPISDQIQHAMLEN